MVHNCLQKNAGSILDTMVNSELIEMTLENLPRGEMSYVVDRVAWKLEPWFGTPSEYKAPPPRRA